MTLLMFLSTVSKLLASKDSEFELGKRGDSGYIIMLCASVSVDTIRKGTVSCLTSLIGLCVKHRFHSKFYILNDFVSRFTQVATFVDESLSQVANKLEHGAQLFPEFNNDHITKLYTCNLYTCAQLETGALYWW